MTLMKIPLTQGYQALVDADDYARLRGYSWRIHRNKGFVYAVRTLPATADHPRRMRLMHRDILGPAATGQTVFKDGNRLNNCRDNLLPTNVSLRTIQSRKHRDNTSGFRGVSWVRSLQRWQARICKDRHVHYLGSFVNPIEAAKAYDTAARRIRGPLARTNF